MTDDQWKKKLTPEQYRIMREKGTEPPFSGKYWNAHEKGMYQCAACGAELFSSAAKFDSGTGWPSFTEPADRENVELRDDYSQGMHRMEVLCKRCGSHLGHVFDDAPKDLGGKPRTRVSTIRGKRYCINSVCLTLAKKQEK